MYIQASKTSSSSLLTGSAFKYIIIIAHIRARLRLRLCVLSQQKVTYVLPQG